jgi:omega-amidase
MPALTVSLIQSSTHWHDPGANREMFDRWLNEVPAETDLVLLPEMFSTGFTMDSATVAEPMQGETVTWLRDQAVTRAKALCGSVVIAEGGEYFNRFICAMPDGELVTYDKRHRFRMAGEHEHYQAGGEKIVMHIAGWRICPMICYDLRFPVWFRNNGDYDAIVCVANWPAARQQAWNTLLRARAIENQAYVAAVNIVGSDGNGIRYGGGSAVYGPDGEVMVEQFDCEQIVTSVLDHAPLATLRKQFPVWQDADKFGLKS